MALGIVVSNILGATEGLHDDVVLVPFHKGIGRLELFTDAVVLLEMMAVSDKTIPEVIPATATAVAIPTANPI